MNNLIAGMLTKGLTAQKQCITQEDQTPELLQKDANSYTIITAHLLQRAKTQNG